MFPRTHDFDKQPGVLLDVWRAESHDRDEPAGREADLTQNLFLERGVDDPSVQAGLCARKFSSKR